MLAQIPNSTPEIRDIKPLEHFAYSPLWYVAGAVLLCAIIFCIWWYLKRRAKKKAPEIMIPPRPAHELALEALTQLTIEENFSKEKEREFAFRISEILRLYIELRFRIYTTDMTTEEIIEKLPKARLEEADSNTAIHILKTTDKIKFADAVFGRNVALGLKETAISFVEETK